MRIQNIDGTASFDLEIIRYQFPDLEDDEWDSNWLVISAKVVTPARSWQFVDPCLLTMEAHDLANWLAALGSGNPTKSRIFFIEPNLSFGLGPSDSRNVELRVYFALESLPPRVDAEIDEFFEVFQVSPDGLKTAASELCRALGRFPVRARARQ